ncbi:MAG: STAS domain-containing protein [Leptospiraceae bacterium]|nr:STAS domain-containing protein [Leptospiraceae bacterium]MCB1200918.1 STAS domain-containing protein [Leptospiraceae bacterium]
METSISGFPITESDTCFEIQFSGMLNTNISQEIRAKLKEMAEKKSLLFDFAKISMISSTGVGALFELNDLLTASNRKLILINPSERASESLKLTGLYDLFTIVNSREKAYELLHERV